jgi:hypothetical protein
MSVCIVDFNGYCAPSHLPVAYWADYDPNSKLVAFGGVWSSLQPLYSEFEPTDEEIEVLYVYAAWIIED